MALSNWDTFGVQAEWRGDELVSVKPWSGRFVTPDEDGDPRFILEIYKNWVMVDMLLGDKQHHVGWIHEGHVQGVGLSDLWLWRGPQEGVYTVWSWRELIVNGNWRDRRCITMVGSGVNGYDERGEHVGTLVSSLEWFEREVLFKKKEGFEQVYEDGEPIYDDRLYCDLPDMGWAKGLASLGVRYNQGDAFFAENGKSVANVTSPGLQTEPAMTAIVKQLFGGG